MRSVDAKRNGEAVERSSGGRTGLDSLSWMGDELLLMPLSGNESWMTTEPELHNWDPETSPPDKPITEPEPEQ
jgi:hypothetical protein